MPYTADIPKPDDVVSASQPPLRENTNTIATIFEVDHQSFNTPNAGGHKKVTFNDGPDYVPAATTLLMYNKVSALTGLQQLYWRRAGGDPVPITEAGPYEAFTHDALHYNWFYLPCGLLVKYGFSWTDPRERQVNLNQPGFPLYTNTPYVFASQGGFDGAPATFGIIRLSSIAPNRFFANSNINNVPFTWFSIGI